MSKEYVMQLEATIENLRRDNTLLKEQNAKYKQLEEQLGCPLEVVFKAIYSGIYYISPNGNTFLERSFKLNHYSSGWYLKKSKLEFSLENYKKTWWLKRDKSE